MAGALEERRAGPGVRARRCRLGRCRRLAQEGLAVILISSDLPEVIGMSDRIGVMAHGTLRAILPGGSDPHTVMAAALGTAA